jgi:hypothetical protein
VKEKEDVTVIGVNHIGETLETMLPANAVMGVEGDNMKKTEKRGKEFGELLMQERIRELNKRRKTI